MCAMTKQKQILKIKHNSLCKYVICVCGSGGSGGSGRVWKDKSMTINVNDVY